MSKKCTAVIILNYNNYEDTINCIESVEKCNTSLIKYIVVDNGSKREKSVESLDKYLNTRFAQNYSLLQEGDNVRSLSYVNLLVSKTNDGYARGNKKGLALAYADDEIDYVMVLNNDILFVQDIIPKLREYAETLPHCGLISPMLYKKDMERIDFNCARRSLPNYLLLTRFPLVSSSWLDKKVNIYQKYLLKNPELAKKDYLQIDLPSGSCMLIRKSAMQKIGDFDAHTFLYYEEDILYKKIEKAGLKNYMIPHLACIHLGGSSTKREMPLVMRKHCVDSAYYYLAHYGDASRVFLSLVHFYLYKILLPRIRIVRDAKQYIKMCFTRK